MQEEENDVRSDLAKPANLEVMSQEALREYLVKLEKEMDRVRDMLAVKGAARTDAEALFRK